MKITDNAVNLDGRTGVAFGVDYAGTRREIIVEVATCRFIGEREVEVDGAGNAKPGTMRVSSSAGTAVAKTIGTKPAG
jgi:hypothetical protein